MCALNASGVQHGALIAAATSSSIARSSRSRKASQPKLQPIRATMKATMAAAIRPSIGYPSRLPLMPIPTTSDDAASKCASQALTTSKLDFTRLPPPLQ